MVGTHAIQATVAFGLLACLLYGPWQWICTDLARQRMFSRRDALFDMALRGEIAFSSPEYQVLRDTINSMIRFSHELTWLRLLLFARLVRANGHDLAPVYLAIQQIGDQNTSAKVRALIADTESAALAMMIGKSPLLLVLAVVTVLPAVMLAIAYFSSRQFTASWTTTLGGMIQREAAFLGG